MNKRIVSVIYELSNLEKKVNMVDLAKEFQISQRTVRNDLNTINDILKEHKLPVLRLEKGGWIVREDDFSQVLGYVEEKDFYDYKLSKEERKKVASILLICAPDYITLSEIADHMVVSRATVINDLEEIKAYIKEGKLEVYSHPNKGLRVEGKESDKRIFLMRLVSYNPDAAAEDIVRKQVSPEDGIQDILSKILYEQEHVHECFLDDSSFQKILIYLEIMTSRLKLGEYVEGRENIENSKYGMAQDIMKYLGQYCHMKITEDEIRFLSELLSFGRYMKQRRMNKDSVKTQLLTRKFIEGISEELGINLNQDYDFFENLSNHLESSLAVKRSDYEKNAVIESVLNENIEVMEAVQKKASIIAQYAGRNLSQIEIGYITVHVCAAIERKRNKEDSFHVIVACHAGIGTSHLLLEKLRKHFNFQIVDIVSSHEAQNLLKYQADFVISTVPLKECKIEHITVSPLLKDEDYIRIGNIIDRMRGRRNVPLREKEEKMSAKELMQKMTPIIYDQVPSAAGSLISELEKIVTDYFKEEEEIDDERYSPRLHQLLPPAHIQLDVSCKDWQDAVRKSAESLLSWGYIEERYIEAMIHNIEENGPYIVISKGFALPHEGVEQGTRKLGMNLVRLATPVVFDAEERDPVEFVCCLSAIDHSTHLKAFFDLVNMLKKEEFKEELRLCQTPEDAGKVIRRYESIVETEER